MSAQTASCHDQGLTCSSACRPKPDIGWRQSRAEVCDLHVANINCVVAKRLLRYLPHERETIPIVLDAACAGVDCGDKTCVAGACADPIIDPNDCPGGTCASPGPDGGTPAPPPTGGGSKDGGTGEGGAKGDASGGDGGQCKIVYAPTVGVGCGNQSCANLCCFPNRCVLNGTQCQNGALRGCDDPADCMSGQKCCAAADGIAGTDSFCKSSCSANEVEVCSTTCDCANCTLGACGLATCGTCPAS